jgi:hypothetical protein
VDDGGAVQECRALMEASASASSTHAVLLMRQWPVAIEIRPSIAAEPVGAELNQAAEREKR